MEKAESKRLAVVMPRLSRYGGAEGFAWRLAEVLARTGYAVDFICARAETEPPAGVRVVEVGRYGLCRAGKILWFARRAEQARRHGAYDLVIGLGNTLNQDLARVGGGPQSVFWRLSKRAWTPGFSRFFKMLRRRLAPSSWAIACLDARRMAGARRIVAVSDAARDWVLEAYPGLDPAKLRVIYNRPDLTQYSPVDEEQRNRLRAGMGLAAEQVLITTAATNFKLKGIEPLLRTLALLPDRFVLHVAGGRGADRYLRLARELGVEHRVRFLGRVEDMASLYRATDVFVLATYYDACSNAVLEALASGCRVLSSRWNGSVRFLPENRVFDDPGDVDVLASLIGECAAEPRPGPFDWPGDVVSGLEPYLELVGEMLAEAAKS